MILIIEAGGEGVEWSGYGPQATVGRRILCIVSREDSDRPAWLEWGIMILNNAEKLTGELSQNAKALNNRLRGWTWAYEKQGLWVVFELRIHMVRIAFKNQKFNSGIQEGRDTDGRKTSKQVSTIILSSIIIAMFICIYFCINATISRPWTPGQKRSLYLHDSIVLAYLYVLANVSMHQEQPWCSVLFFFLLVCHLKESA